MYTVTFDIGAGAKVTDKNDDNSPALTSMAIKEGDPCDFCIFVSDGYTLGEVKIEGQTDPLVPGENGFYTIANIAADIKVVVGVTKNVALKATIKSGKTANDSIFNSLSGYQSAENQDVSGYKVSYHDVCHNNTSGTITIQFRKYADTAKPEGHMEITGTFAKIVVNVNSGSLAITDLQGKTQTYGVGIHTIDLNGTGTISLDGNKSALVKVSYIEIYA